MSIGIKYLKSPPVSGIIGFAMKKQELDGQLNLFGSAPYQPKKAEGGETPEVMLDTEAEEFLSVGRRRKSQKKSAEPATETEEPAMKSEPPAKPEPPVEEKAPVVEKVTAPASEPAEKPAKPASKPKKQPASVLHAVMQKSFVDADGRVATAAYVDYNCVYVESAAGRAKLIHYPESKIAVSAYLAEVEKLAKTAGMKKTDEHPALRHVTVKEFEEI